MRPYYEDGSVTIYHADCRDVLPWIEEGYQIAIVSDPPYGIMLRNGDVDGHRSARSFGIVGDDDGAIGRWMIGYALGRLTVAVFASPWEPWPGDWRNLIAWDKGGAVGGGGDPATCLKRTWELIQVSNRSPLLTHRAESVWRCAIVPSDTRDHIAAKPVALMGRIIATFVPSHETVVDPFAGTGSTLVAAKLRGRRAIGIEIEERYCEIAAERCRQEVLVLGQF